MKFGPNHRRMLRTKIHFHNPHQSIVFAFFFFFCKSKYNFPWVERENTKSIKINKMNLFRYKNLIYNSRVLPQFIPKTLNLSTFHIRWSLDPATGEIWDLKSIPIIFIRAQFSLFFEEKIEYPLSRKKYITNDQGEPWRKTKNTHLSHICIQWEQTMKQVWRSYHVRAIFTLCDNPLFWSLKQTKLEGSPLFPYPTPTPHTDTSQGRWFIRSEKCLETISTSRLQAACSPSTHIPKHYPPP